MLETTSILVFLGLLLSLIGLRTIYRAYFTSLHDVPGPRLARFTRIWLAKAIYSRQYHKISTEIHRKYGPIVRIAPNEYSIDDADAAQIIYRSRDPLIKSSRYQGFDLPNVEQSLFTTQNNDHNNWRRRQVHPLYQLGALTNIEFQVDNMISVFLAKMEKFASSGTVIDMAKWLHFYTFDCTGALTFGKPFGCIEEETDIADLISVAHTTSRYGAVVGIFSEWHPALFQISQWISPKGNYGMAYLHSFAKQALAERAQRSEEEKSLSEEKSQGGDVLESDYLGTFLAKARRYPDTFTVDDASYHMMSNLLAGGESTGISVSAAIYFLCKNPQSLEKLRHEIKGLKTGSLDMKYINLKDASNCQYLQAVIKETVRMFPAVGINMTRVVPEGGLTLAGRFFPGNTVVGTCAWASHFNSSVFGPDAETFRPERWLESEELVSKLDQHYFGFGRGPRACVGKNIALMELSKLIPELMLRFDISFADPNHDWTVHSDGFVKPEDFFVRLTKRKAGE